MIKRLSILVLCASLVGIAPVPAQAAGKVREVKVAIATAPSYKKIKGWKQKFEKRLAYTSDIFKREAGIKFKAVKWMDWPIKNETMHTHEMLDDLRERFPLRGYDVVIGLSRLQSLPDLSVKTDYETLGRARPLSGYVVLRYPNDPLFKVQEETLLAHEMGHIFGATHTKDPESIMFPITHKQIPTKFDHENRDIVKMMKGFDFERGVNVLDKRANQQLLNSYVTLLGSEQNEDFYYMLGVLYMKNGQPNDAVKVWEQAAAFEDASPRILIDLGILYNRMGNYKKGVRKLTTAVNRLDQPRHEQIKFQALNALGEAYLGDNNLAGAFNALTRAKAINGEDMNVQVNLARVLLKRGQASKAASDLKKLLLRDPNNLKVLTYLGNAYHAAGDNESALQTLQKALRVIAKAGSPKSQASLLSKIYSNLGAVYFDLKDSKKGVASYEQSCNAYDSIDCRIRLAQVYYRAQRWSDVIRELAGVLQHRKDDPTLYGLLGVAFSSNGETQKALGIFREGIQHAEDNDEAAANLHNNLGHLYFQNHHPDLAEKEFRLAITKNWQHVDAHVGLGMAYLRKTNLNAAKKSLENALRINPKHSKARKLIKDIEKMIAEASTPTTMRFRQRS